jgi:hypothetical protein
MTLSGKKGRKEGRKEGGREEEGKRKIRKLGGEVAQIMYTHVSKCKNHNIKLKRKRNI